MRYHTISTAKVDMTLLTKQHLHKLNEGHGGIVTTARHGADDSCVASFTLLVPARSISKDGVHQSLVIDESKCLSAGVQGPSLRQRDHVVNILAHGLGTGLCGLDSSVPQQLSGQATQQGSSLVSRPA